MAWWGHMGATCCKACTNCSRSLDYQLDDTMWKETFSKPGGCIGACGCLPPKAYLAVRILIFLVWLGCCIWSTVDHVVLRGHHYGYWWIKLTHWGALVELIYFASAAFTTYKAIYGKDADGTGERTPRCVSFTWFMSSVIPVVSMMVCAMFWVLVFKPGPGKPEPIAVAMHGGNFVLVLIDLLLTRQPFYIQHVYAPFLFASVYCLFTFVYYHAGGTEEDGTSRYIYKAVDWSKPSGTGRLLGLIVFVGVPIMHLLLCSLAFARVRCQKADEEGAPEADVEDPPALEGFAAPAASSSEPLAEAAAEHGPAPSAGGGAQDGEQVAPSNAE
mmetsp:Transcript_55729/g.180948  ORF Transcript_55729/g.180948 Transcript_55729/m.180948 type:complete len:329 (+) Transcript_55729:136-1122(+)